MDTRTQPVAAVADDVRPAAVAGHVGRRRVAARDVLRPADAPASAGSDAPSADTAASERSSSDASSSASPRRAWRAELAAAVGSLVWCTYRSHFPPIAQDGFIGADEEATSAAVSAATEELCAPHDAAEDATDSTSSAGEAQAPLTQLLARSRSELGSTAATRGWLVQQLASRGWQLPGLLAQLPVTAGLLSRQEPVTPAAVATSLQAILDAVEHDVLYALPRPLTASAPFARLRDSLVSSLPTPTGLPGVWGYVKAIYESVSSIAQPAGPTSDAGWGCMLRTVQSLLATALVRVHLGRSWRLPPVRDGRVQWRSDEEHATYTRILTLFLDDPSSACPFSIHRLAAEGKRLGIDVGAWFGPSTAASVVQRLAQPTHLGVGVAATNDGLVYVDDVVAASHDWTRPVLVLVAQRLGLDEVPKAYRTALKQLFAFPQSVGVAGGRPSSSVYFVGSQREHLLYLDPHTTRASVPFRHAPPSLRGAELLRTAWGATDEPRSQGTEGQSTEGQGAEGQGVQPSGPQPSGPQPSAQPYGQPNAQPNAQSNGQPTAQPNGQPNGQPSEPPNSQPGAQSTAQPTAPQSDSPAQPDGSPSDSTPQPKRTDRVAASDPAPDGLACDDPPPPDDATRTLLTSWYCNAYAPVELATFRTTSTQQMPLGVVDPSVLLGFVVHTRAELDDLARRAEQLGAPLFRVAPHRLTYASSDAASDVASDAASDTDSSWAL
ncbi:ATG4 [Malassezia furfur]|nr:ATG4 [Malassezia furfur]